MSTTDSGGVIDPVPADSGPFSAESIAAIANELFHTVTGGLAPEPSAGTDSVPHVSAVEDVGSVPASSPSTVVDLGSTSVPGAPSTGAGSSGTSLFAYDSIGVDPYVEEIAGLTELTAFKSLDQTSSAEDPLDVEGTDIAPAVAGFDVPPTLLEDLDVATLLGKATAAPTTPEAAADDAAGDHPFLYGKYAAGLDAAKLNDEGAGQASLEIQQSDEFAAIAHEFTGAHTVDPALKDLIGYSNHPVEVATEEPLDDPIAVAAAESTLTRDSGLHEAMAAPDRVPAQQAASDSAADGEDPGNAGPYVFTPSLLASTDESEYVSDLDIAPTTTGFNAYRYREDFPILKERINGHELVWLDNGATSQKPQQVIDRMSYFYEHENSNVHRTAHTLAGRATDAYEGAREKVRDFINAPSAKEVIWVRGTTEGINLIANTYGEQNVGEGDEVLISWLEHHANIVPWQMLCRRKGATLKVAPVDDTGQIILSEYERLITPRTKIISFTHVSNALGTITPAKEMIEIAHRHDVPVVIDGAQGILHMPVDVQDLGCDFYVFSGHKMFAPLGIGVVWGRESILNNMQPWQGGGNMIDKVYFDRTTYQPPPWRFEAGTGSIADAVGLGASIDYLNDIGMSNIQAHEHDLLEYATKRLNEVPGITIYGHAVNKAAVMSFNIAGHEPEDVGTYLDGFGIAVRAGHHCAQPILRRFGTEGTVRAAFALYNIREDVDRLVDALIRLVTGATTT